MEGNGPPKASPTPVHTMDASDEEDDTSFLSPQDEHSPSPLGALDSSLEEDDDNTSAPTAAVSTSKDRAAVISSEDEKKSAAAVSTSKERASPPAMAATSLEDEKKPAAAVVSTSKERASPPAMAATSLEDEKKPAAAVVSTSKERASPPAMAATSLEDEKKSAAAVVSNSKERASPAPADTSLEDDEVKSAAIAAVSTSKDRASSPVVVVTSLEDGHEKSAAVSTSKNREVDADDTSAAAAAAISTSLEDKNKSRAEDRASSSSSSSSSSASAKDDSRAASDRGASPAVALMCSEDDDNNKSAASAVSNSTKESNREFEAAAKSELVSSGETQAQTDSHSPQKHKTNTPIDTILMVPEDGDPPHPTAPVANHYNFTSYGESKSSSALEVKSDNALKEEKTESKIVARPSATDDDYLPSSVSSPFHRRCVSVDLIAKVPANYNTSSTTPSPKTADSGAGGGLTRGLIDTAPPIDSVKAAVSKFGGIVDWKAHRHHTVERRKFIEQELDKAQEEMPSYKQQCESANEAKMQVLKKLESTKRLIEELKLNLERAQTEEQQAKQDSELAKLRVEEMEQGIANESSFAAKAQLEVAKARHAAAVSELKSVQDELEQLRRDYDLLIAEKDAAEKKAEEALFASKQVDKSVESLTIELITLKQSLESAHSAHLEAEEHRIGAVMAKEQDSLNWEVELKQAEEELEKLNQQMITTKELKSKLAEAMKLLHDLKAELAAYMESKPEKEENGSGDPLKEPETKTRADIESAINAAKKELSDVKLKIEKATQEVNILKVASASLKSQLENENAQLQAIRQREGMTSIAATSLETELNRIKTEINIIQMKEKEEREKLVELPMQLQKAAQEAEQAKALAQTAGEELKKAKDEAEEAKAGVSSRESKLRSVQKEIEAAKASERLALAAINALSAQKNDDPDSDSANGITLSLEEYYELSKRAHEAEEQANARVAAAMSQIEKAKESEVKSLIKLEEVSREMSQRKDALEIALHKTEQATQRKLSVEQELRKWRADHEQRRKKPSESASPINTGKESKHHDSSSSHHQKSPKSGTSSKGGTDSAQEGKGGKKKKKSFFPRIFMFLGKRKSHSSKPE